MTELISNEPSVNSGRPCHASPRGAEDEIDLVDVIVFFWKIRYILATGAILGLLCGWLSTHITGSTSASMASTAPSSSSSFSYQFALQEDFIAAQTALDRPARMALLNELLQRSDTMWIFFETLSKSLPELNKAWSPPSDSFAALMSTQQDEKQRSIWVTESDKTGEILFHVKIPVKIEDIALLTAVTAAFNQVVTEVNQRQHANYEKNIESLTVSRHKLLSTEAAASGQLFRLVKQYKGQQADLTPFLIKYESVGAAGTQKDVNIYFKQTIDNIVRMIGILEVTGAIDAKQAESEKTKVQSFLADYKATLFTLSGPATVASRDLLAPLLAFPQSVKVSNQPSDKATADVLSAAPKARISTRLLLGVFLGLFFAFLLGGIKIFVATNLPRIKEAISNKKGEPTS